MTMVRFTRAKDAEDGLGLTEAPRVGCHTVTRSDAAPGSTEPKGASRTALFIAAYRARATAWREPICRDPYAAAFAGEDGMALATRYDELNPNMELWTAVRTAFIDARLNRATSSDFGVRQVVLLGAGFDTRAARLARDGVRYFEVDSPASQAEKLRRIAGIAEYPTNAATHVQCDFEVDDFVERLTSAGFDAASPAFVIWEGVIPYLTEAAVRATLRSIATRLAPESIVVFDHVGKRLVGGDVQASDRVQREFVDVLGEPLRFGIDDALPLLFEEGFRRVRSCTFDEACLDLTGTYDRARKFKFQSLVVATRAAPALP